MVQNGSNGFRCCSGSEATTSRHKAAGRDKNAILNAKWVSVSGSNQLGIALQRQNERWYKYEVGHGGARDEFATRFESSSAWVRKGARHGGAAARMADDRAELSEGGEESGSRDKEARRRV